MVFAVGSSSDSTSSTQSRPSNHWNAARKAVFGKVKINIAGRSRMTTRLDVFLDRLQQAALKGETDAVRQRTRLRRYLDESRILDAAPEVSAGRQAVLDSMARQQSMAKFAGVFLSLAHAMMDEFLEIKDPVAFALLAQSKRANPHGIDFEIGRKCMKSAVKKSAAKQSNSEPDIGYANPPKATQWRKSQSGNPSGRRKRVDDGWTTFRNGLIDWVAVRINGKPKKLISDEVITIQLFDSAGKGDRGARRLVCDLLLELDHRHLLTPSPPRRRRKKVSPEVLRSMTSSGPIILDIALLDVMRSREEGHTAFFGPHPDFQSDIDRKVAVAVEQLRQSPASQERCHGQDR